MNNNGESEPLGCTQNPSLDSGVREQFLTSEEIYSATDNVMVVVVVRPSPHRFPAVLRTVDGNGEVPGLGLNHTGSHESDS